MAGTFSQIYIQVIFSPSKRENIIRSDWDEELFKYIGEKNIITPSGF